MAKNASSSLAGFRRGPGNPATVLLAVAALTASVQHVAARSGNERVGGSAVYEIWETEPAPNRGADTRKVISRGYPYDSDWDKWSYPIGNGHMGANLFGRTDTERVQITDKRLSSFIAISRPR